MKDLPWPQRTDNTGRTDVGGVVVLGYTPAASRCGSGAAVEELVQNIVPGSRFIEVERHNMEVLKRGLRVERVDAIADVKTRR
jgi:hypothetical protein